MTPDRDVNNNPTNPADAEVPDDQRDGIATDSGVAGGPAGPSAETPLGADPASNGAGSSSDAAAAGDDAAHAFDDPLGFGGQRIGDEGVAGSVDGAAFDLDGGLNAGLAGAGVGATAAAAAGAPGGTGEQVAAGDDVQSLRAALEQAEARATENWDRLLRLQADMENQRKRAQKEVGNARKFALEPIVEDLLPVKDSLELGLVAAEAPDANITSIREGAELTLKMLIGVFDKHNIVELNPLDEKFDPTFHQAMSLQAVEGKEPNTVTTVMQKGYTLNDRLVRPALVMVAK